VSSKEPEANFNKFINKLTIYCGLSSLIDGYILASIGPALIALGPLLHLDNWWTGAIGAGALMGILVGGPVFGTVSDAIGRKKPFVLIPLAFAILSIAICFVESTITLFIIRFMFGLVIGADYTSATSYLSEYSPAHRRGTNIGIMMIMWISGMTLGEVVGYIVYDSVYNWQIILGIPAIISFWLAWARRNYPESPRWLMNKNRVEEATVIVHKVYGPTVDVSMFEEKAVKHASVTELFKPYYLKRVIFAGLFWATQVLPMFAIYIFGPSLLKAIKLSEGRDLLLGDSIVGLIFVVGVVFGAAIIEKFNRRPLIICSFVGMAFGLFVLGLIPEPSFGIIVVCFTIYAISSGPPNVLDWVYPNELFPTEIRAVGVGVSTMISRMGPILGTFALPSFLEAFGIQMTMLAMGGVLIFGLIICIFLAPETRGLNLAEASGSAAIGTEEKVMEKLEEEHNQLEEIIVRKDID
jgi:putative MFS transporter